MPSTRENVAYDLSLFAPREAREEAEQQAKQDQSAKKVKQQAKAVVHPAVVIRWTALALFIALSLAAMMMCNVQLTKLNDEMAKSQAQLTAAQGEQVRLNMQLESRTSLSNVEDYAVNKLGLQKSNLSQITYIHLANQDKVEITPKNENIFSNLINFILEYL